MNQRRTVLQGRTGRKDGLGREMIVCSECEITYPIRRGERPVCPLCEQRKETQQVRQSLFEMTNAHHMLQNQHHQLQAQVDHLTAMRSAFEIMDAQDLTFIKSVIYRWQADRSGVALKPMHKSKGRKRGGFVANSVQVAGFVAIFRRPDSVEEHRCSSMGGLALASYLEEAQSLIGQMKAMETLVRAALVHLEATVES